MLFFHYGILLCSLGGFAWLNAWSVSLFSWKASFVDISRRMMGLFCRVDIQDVTATVLCYIFFLLRKIQL